MARLNALDLAKINGSDAIVGLIEENIALTPEVQNLSSRTIKGTSFKTLIRTGLPTVGFRKLNTGVTPSKSTFKTDLVEAYILSSRIEVDQASLDGADRSPEDVKAIEASGVMEAALRTIGSQVWYGIAADATGFPGIKTLVVSGLTIDATGSTATTGSSIFAVRDGPQDVQLLFGNNSVFDLSPWRPESIIDASAARFPGQVADLVCYVGMQCTNQYCCGRIKNITADAGHTASDALIAQLLSKFRGRAPDRLYMSRRSAYQLQISRSVTIMSLAGQKPLSSSMPIAPYPTESNGIPISVSDQIIDTEVING